MIFDVDGTLVDSNDAHARAWVAAFADHGISVVYEPVRRAIGMGGDKLMPLVAGIKEDTPKGKEIANRRKQMFKQVWLPTLKPFPRTRELVQRLCDDGFMLAVASSATEDEVQPLLKAAGVAESNPHAHIVGRCRQFETGSRHRERRARAGGVRRRSGGHDW